MEEKSLISSTLYQLAMELQAAQKRAKELGIFVENRDLLMCDTCKLMEDVDIRGVLSTYVCPADFYDPEPPLDWKAPPDTGLRFEEIGEDEFRCPVCGAVIQYEDLAKFEEDDLE
jgi:rubredoxin